MKLKNVRWICTNTSHFTINRQFNKNVCVCVFSIGLAQTKNMKLEDVTFWLYRRVSITNVYIFIYFLLIYVSYKNSCMK